MGAFAIVMAICLASLFALLIGLELIGRLGAKEDPETILADRFAKGEIDEAEYSRRLTILRYGPPLELPD